MSQALMDYVSARHDAILAALALLTAEYRLADDGASALAVTEAERVAGESAYRLMLAVGELPRDRQPVGWAKPGAVSGVPAVAFRRFTSAALRVISAEHADESADADAESEYANDMLCHAARNLALDLDAQAAERAGASGRLL